MSEKSCEKLGIWKIKGDGHNRGELSKEGVLCVGGGGGGFKPSIHHDIEQLKVLTLEALNYWGGLIWRRGPDLKGAISHPSSCHEFNLASYNGIVSFKSCTCLMLFPKDNLKARLGDKHQRGIAVSSRMPILKRTYCRTFYSLFYMVYDLSIWYILHFTINGPNYFFSSSSCIGSWASIIVSSVTSYLFWLEDSFIEWGWAIGRKYMLHNFQLGGGVWLGSGTHPARQNAGLSCWKLSIFHRPKITVKWSKTPQMFFRFSDSLHRYVDLYSKTKIKCDELLIIITHSQFLHFHNRENHILNIGKESRP